MTPQVLHWVTAAMEACSREVCGYAKPSPVSPTLQPLSLEREDRIKMAAEIKLPPIPQAFPGWPGTC